jgi:hypothetical protein
MSGRRGGPWYQWVITRCERGYRWWAGLDRPAARVGSALTVHIITCRRRFELADGSLIRPGDQAGMIHLDNARLAALHEPQASPGTVGIAFRRRFATSLSALAAEALDGGPLGSVRAFTATTIFSGIERMGFAEAPGDRPVAARFIGLYQRALLASLHPRGSARARRYQAPRARRVWISRERLLALHGPATGPRDVSRSGTPHATEEPRA